MQGAARNWDIAITKAFAFFHRDESLRREGQRDRQTEGGRDRGRESERVSEEVSNGRRVGKMAMPLA